MHVAWTDVFSEDLWPTEGFSESNPMTERTRRPQAWQAHPSGAGASAKDHPCLQ